MLQCYRCHTDVPPGMIRHRMVNTGTTVRGRGFASRYRKVALCPKCATMHDFWQKTRWRMWVAIAVLAGVIGLGVLIKFVFM